MEIYIVRHGKTLWNKEKRLQGSADIELAQEGRDVAIQTGDALKDVHFDKIYSSPLSRAYETAKLIRGDRDIEIICDDRLRELNFGENEGRRVTEIQEEEDNPFNKFFTKPEEYYPLQGGESLEEICERAKSFIKEVIEPQAKDLQRIMIVGHGAVNKAIMCYVLDHGIDEYWSGGLQRNCGTIIVRLDDNGYGLIEENTTFY